MWVAPRGTDNLVRSSAIIPIAYRDSLLEIPGIVKADAILKSFVTITPMTNSAGPGKKLSLLGIGYMTPDGLGGPPFFSGGRPPDNKGEIALDRAAAIKLGVKIDEKVLINGNPKLITGLTGGTNLLVTHFAFKSYNDFDELAPYAGLASFFIINVQQGFAHDQVAEEISQRLPGVVVYRQNDFIENNRKETAAGYIVILRLVYILGITAAAVLVALIIHGIVEEKRIEMAVLLALGAHESGLWLALGVEGVRLSLAGSLAGTVLTAGLGYFLDMYYPVIPLSFVAMDVLKLTGLLAVSALAATALPILTLRNIDPLEAFHQ